MGLSTGNLVTLIRIREQHIAAARKMDREGPQAFAACPLWMALKEERGPAYKVTVDTDTATVVYLGAPGAESYWTCNLSPALTEMLSDFDAGKEVKPSSFVLTFKLTVVA